MATEGKDLKLTSDERNKLFTILNAVSVAGGFDANICFYSIGPDWFFLPEGVNGQPAAILALAEYCVAHP